MTQDLILHEGLMNWGGPNLKQSKGLIFSEIIVISYLQSHIDHDQNKRLNFGLTSNQEIVLL